MTASHFAPADPTQATDPAGPTGLLVDWLAGLSLNDVPDDVIARAKDLLLDGVACAFVGARLPWSDTAVDAVVPLEGRGDRTIIGRGQTTSAPAAALLNGTFIQGFELDDFHPAAPLHSASLILPALLAAAEEADEMSGERFLLATIAGLEVGPRVGRALHGGQMLSRGWHSGAVFGTHAAAAATGVLLRLNPGQLEDALGLAGTQSAGLMAAQYEAMCKRMHHGFSARNGLYATMLARGGYTGIKRVFEREYGGFLSVFGEGHDPDASQIAADLGTRWETREIGIKRYAAMGALHSPLDVILELRETGEFTPDEVETIDVYLSHAAYHHGWWVPERPLTPIGAQMNVGYAVAVGLLDGAAMGEQFSPTRIDADDVWALVPRVAAHHDPAYDVRPEQKMSTRLVVRLKDGRKVEGTRSLPDTIGKPLDHQGVVDKYRTLVSPLIDGDRMAAVEAVIDDLENLSVSALITLLAPSVRPLFGQA